MAQSEGVWSQPWHKPQNDPVPAPSAGSVLWMPSGWDVESPNVTMGLTLLAAGKGGHNLQSPPSEALTHYQSGIHQTIPDCLVLYQDC